MIDNTLRLRKESRYALSLSQWLQIEAERSKSLSELWADYLFIVFKLGFSEISLINVKNDRRKTWKSKEEANPENFRCKRFEILDDASFALEFGVDSNEMSTRVFELLADLGAEAWIKAAHRCEFTNKQILKLETILNNTSQKFES